MPVTAPGSTAITTVKILTQDGINSLGDGDNSVSKKKKKKKKKKVKVTFEKYQRMANLIAIHLRTLENTNRPGLTQDEIVKYYLEQIGVGDDQEEVQTETKLCVRVIKRLLEKDNVLVRVGGEDDFDGDQADGDSSGKALIMVHPNYVLQ